VTNSNFQMAQMTYLWTNSPKFDDEQVEENKLEYTEIHEGYIKILDEKIDEKLKEKYTKE